MESMHRIGTLAFSVSVRRKSNREGRPNYMFRMLIHRSKKLLPSGILFTVSLLLAAMPSAWAQTDQGAITGVVQDDQGAVISGAKVTLTATDTDFSLERTANGDGVFI